MRILSFVCFAALFCGCNLNYPADSTAALPGRITKTQVLQYLPAIRFGRSQSIETIASKKESFRIKADFIVHSRFLFLDFAEDKKGQLDNYKEITQEFQVSSAVSHIYDIEQSSLALQYEDFLGRNVVINTSERSQLLCKISRLVLITDAVYHEPYLAAVLETPENTWLNYSWATTNKRINPYPFIPVEDEALAELALIHFDSLSEYHRIKELPAYDTETYDYEETNIRIFEFRKSEKYILVQYNYIGNCGSLQENYTALYHVTPGNWVREAEGSVHLFFNDLIDIDGDLYPELLMTGFTQTAIYEINYKGFSEVKSMSWSTTECPC